MKRFTRAFALVLEEPVVNDTTPTVVGVLAEALPDARIADDRRVRACRTGGRGCLRPRCARRLRARRAHLHAALAHGVQRGLRDRLEAGRRHGLPRPRRLGRRGLRRARHGGRGAHRAAAGRRLARARRVRGRRDVPLRRRAHPPHAACGGRDGADGARLLAAARPGAAPTSSPATARCAARASRATRSCALSDTFQEHRAVEDPPEPAAV